ncbi:MAG: hypothetical protein COS76_02315 [Candidatus Portnoybacteria bacterium CG06_land_8_20_14_3_00_39_12]|uniref:Sec-independent protein translocase protein TatC n=1 Tax=Candidatus Portnoybacteria bacterium CG06_land_8_20_14_3_00_39_12 TaxID=1974809 RepID=A0A2M7AX04_9BACT|nr:MAG: hypothetical protein COS76_02315 [Candidatus Portnoybacteria bacterium CG06_land_8_20_14_3_00_39_12]
MPFFDELREFCRKVLPCFVLFFLFAFFFFSFGLREFQFFGKKIPLPFPSFDSFSIFFFRKIQNYLLPGNVQLIVTSPLTAFLAQVIVSLFLSFILTFPYFLFKIFNFLSPAFYRREKNLLIKIFFPSLFLFISGCLFSYFFLIAPTLKILYFFTEQIGAIPFLEVNNFLILFFGLIFATGILFLLPIFMTLLTLLGIVEPEFWKRNFFNSSLFFLILSAIITPDDTGVTMLILFLPLMGLYILGYFFAKILKRS